MACVSGHRLRLVQLLEQLVGRGTVRASLRGEQLHQHRPGPGLCGGRGALPGARSIEQHAAITISDVSRREPCRFVLGAFIPSWDWRQPPLVTRSCNVAFLSRRRGHFRPRIPVPRVSVILSIMTSPFSAGPPVSCSFSFAAGTCRSAQPKPEAGSIITVTPATVETGSPELIRVEAPHATGVEATWLGRKLEFFPSRNRSAGSP